MSVQPKLAPDSYSGSPYVPKDFKEGKLIANGKEIPGFIRYNVLANQMEIKIHEGSEVITLPRDLFKAYIINNVEYSWENLFTEDGWKNGYFIKYYERNDLKFYGFPELSKKRAVASTGFVEGRPAHYNIVIKYYLSSNNSDLNSVRIKNKDFRKVLNIDNKGKEYLNEHKLKEVTDVVKFLEFYDAN